MLNPAEILKWTVTLGGKQNFLGAPWIRRVLERTPPHKRKERALWLLWLSPHYFHKRNAPPFDRMSNDEYRHAFFRENGTYRQMIYDKIFANMDLGKTVMDYGCGPGSFAIALAKNVEKVIACDISPGTIACARILNAADNLTYTTSDDEGLALVPEHSIDTLISLNMVQHLGVGIYHDVLGKMGRLVKPGGKLILHIQLDDPAWRSEEEWLADRSIKGKLKYRYGIHCFSLTAEQHTAMAGEHGFENIEIRPVSFFTDHVFDDIGEQHIMTATRKL